MLSMRISARTTTMKPWILAQAKKLIESSRMFVLADEPTNYERFHWERDQVFVASGTRKGSRHFVTIHGDDRHIDTMFESAAAKAIYDIGRSRAKVRKKK